MILYHDKVRGAITKRKNTGVNTAKSQRGGNIFLEYFLNEFRRKVLQSGRKRDKILECMILSLCVPSQARRTLIYEISVV